MEVEKAEVTMKLIILSSSETCLIICDPFCNVILSKQYVDLKSLSRLNK